MNIPKENMAKNLIMSSIVDSRYLNTKFYHMVVSRVTSTSQVKTFSNKNTNEMSPENNLRLSGILKSQNSGEMLQKIFTRSTILFLYLTIDRSKMYEVIR
jgi:hypothetical protein